MVFYDVTTFSFENVKAGGLKDFGFSRDAKFKEVPVVMDLKKITDKGYGYIFACRIKAMGKKMLSEIISGSFAEAGHSGEKIKILGD